MYTQGKTVGSLAEYIELICSMSKAGRQWFRGHRDGGWELTPSLYRIEVPDPESMLRLENRLITRFRQRSLPVWPEGYPQNSWEQLFAMQHYGIPTRLLDWTENALTAAYFASSSSDLSDNRWGPCVWVLDPVALNRQNSRLSGMSEAITVFTVAESDDQYIAPWAPNSSPVTFGPDPIALYGTHNTTRIVAQSGVFTVGGKEMRPLDKAPNAEFDGTLQKISFSVNACELRAQCLAIGMNESAIFPGLDSVGRDIVAQEMR